MDVTLLLKDKKAIFVGLDDVLFPKKDYDLQVYYLFAQFLEMTGAHSAEAIVNFIKESNLPEEEEQGFNNLIDRFDFVAKYRSNFDRLYKTARLPLKLFMYQKMCDFLSSAIESGLNIYLVTEGDPETQLNKIKQVNWLGLEQKIRIFFADKVEQPIFTVVDKLLKDNNLLPQQALFITKNKLVLPQTNLIDLPYILARDINS